ncbi:MAG: sulfurtransferase TusA family protein [Acidimicrobiia bacterium]|nr:sulfurtransferase TusA family protein [Acidimicrobiia bacterium]
MTRDDTIQKEPTETLDTSGMLCPLPVYKAGLALKGLEQGDVLRLVCTDPGSLADIPAFARQGGHVLLEVDDQGSTQTFLIEKGPGS